MFVVDMKKHAAMAALTKERDSLKSAIQTYKSLFDTTQQLIDELKGKYSTHQLLSLPIIVKSGQKLRLDPD